MTMHAPFRRLTLLAVVTTAIHGFPNAGTGQEVSPAPGGIGETELSGNAEILTRGPVHEAFAEAYSADAEASIAVNRAPPEPIDEMPPEVMPDGENVEWIPGYWAWDDDRSDFIWVSGVWRNVPPGQRWVPGAWVRGNGTYRWTAGFWTSADMQEVTYLPEPPPSQEEGPSSPAPDDNHFWVPGSWRYVSNNYAWQPGYWAPAYDNWLWVPARYVWTPYGSIYCDGYWDYDMAHRGVLFSPVYFPGYRYPNFVPRHVVSIGPLLIHLFVRPRYHHYYFGDYYGDAYAGLGIVPWLGVRQYGFYRYDPLFAYYQTGFFNGRGGLLGRIAGWHNYYRRNPDFRPRHTLADARDFSRQRGDRDDNVVRQAVLTRSLDEVRETRDREFELRDVAPPQRERIAERARATRDLERLRGDRRDRDASDRRLTLPRHEQPDRVRSELRERIPERPDADQDRRRRVTRPEELDEPPKRTGRERSRTDDGSQPSGRDQVERRGPSVRDQGRPAERERTQSPDRGTTRDGRSTPERDRSPRSRRPMVFPDVPRDGGQEAAPIPRPTETRPQARTPRENREQPAPRRERIEEPAPRPQDRGTPVPNATPRSGNRANPPPGARGGDRGGAPESRGTQRRGPPAGSGRAGGGDRGGSRSENEGERRP